MVPAIGSGIALIGTTCGVTTPAFTVSNGATNGGLNNLTQTDVGFGCTAVANPAIENPGILSVTVTTPGTGYGSAPQVTLTTPGDCGTAPTFTAATPTAPSGTVSTVSLGPPLPGGYGVACANASEPLKIQAPGILSYTVVTPGNGYTSSTAPGQPGPPSSISNPPIVVTGCATAPTLTSTVNANSNVAYWCATEML